jgi:hypothetical protein
VVEIAGVPDDEHVVVRSDDGTETTLALDQIGDAVLVVDWSRLGKRGQ